MTEPLQPRALQTLRLLSVHAVALSPDAALVAFGVRPSRPQAGTTLGGFLPSGAPLDAVGVELWLAPLDGGPARPLTADGNSWLPHWSPDGRTLAFYSDRDGQAMVWLWDRQTGAFRRACAEPIHAIFEFQAAAWLPDSRRLLVRLRVPGWNPPPDQEDQPKGQRDVWVSPPSPPEPDRPPAPGWQQRDGKRADLAVLDTATGAVHRLSQGLHPYGMAVSPDGRYVAATCLEADGEGVDGNVGSFALHLFGLDGARHDILARHLRQAFGVDFAWSPSSDAIALLSRTRPRGRLLVVPIDGGETREYGGDLDLGNEEGFTPPLWSADGQSVYSWGAGRVYAVARSSGEAVDLAPGWGRGVAGMLRAGGSNRPADFGRPGTVAVVAIARETRRQGLWRLGGGEPEALVPERHRRLIDLLLRGDADDRWLVGPVEAPAHPYELFAFDLVMGEERRPTVLNPELRAAAQTEVRRIAFFGMHGEERQAALYLPPDYRESRRYPTVMHVYITSGAGGSGFAQEFHLLTSRGYIVLKPDLPALPDVEHAEWVTAYALKALEAAVAAGYVDPGRVGLMGHSHGGYDTCCIISRTDRFRAAVAASGMTDLVTQSLEVKGNALPRASWVEGGFIRLGATLWEAPDRYLRNSPVFQADKITTPLLLLHGTADAVAITQSEELYGALLRLGKVATLVRYHSEGHVPLWWAPENYADYWRRIFAWFARYVGGSAEMAPDQMAETGEHGAAEE
jgi:dipeptidyl aminopeptidase/acylaminoacyl peptidase